MIIPKRMGMGPKNSEIFIEDGVVYLRFMEDQSCTYHTMNLDTDVHEMEILLPLLEIETWPRWGRDSMLPKKQKPKEFFKRGWSPDDLSDIWEFSQHDFDRFLELLMWLDNLE